MMKLLTLAAATGAAAAADEPLGRTTQTRSLDGMTTEDLEASTRQFAEASLKQAKGPGKKARGNSGGKKQRQRALRYGTTRAWRGAEKSSSDDDEWWGPGGNRKKGRKGGELQRQVIEVFWI